ncbi:hypothetical protein [Streptomyces sp. MP131-18]|uniref:hypothetical protein n=1 Tax=Streptomyces sp. MP131-18 TaxID=1857892 RepID=UPI00097C1920|nr:hypothetical protein [Streptomyces sp. MP131-18]ONK13106.1 hypothetical protein STBA_38680 [Streptomyces sp. MP131-18]
MLPVLAIVEASWAFGMVVLAWHLRRAARDPDFLAAMNRYSREEIALIMTVACAAWPLLLIQLAINRVLNRRDRRRRRRDSDRGKPPPTA